MEKDYKYYIKQWSLIRDQIMEEWGIDEEDLEDEDNEDVSEDELNRETDDLFHDKYGFDIIDTFPEV